MALPHSDAVEPTATWLALDEVVDPQNLGALVRSAAFLGAAGIVVSAKNSATIGPTVSKASAGAVEIVPVHATRNMPRFLNSAKEVGTATPAAEQCPPAIHQHQHHRHHHDPSNHR